MRPIPFGFAGFTTASGAGSGTGPALRWQMAGLALLGLGTALAVLLRGRLPALGRGWRALRPGPHGAAMRRAAEAGDLIALRAAAEAHLAWRCGAGRASAGRASAGRASAGPASAGQQAGGPRHRALLGQLDRRIYAPPDAAGFDATLWLRAWLRARG